MIIRVLLLMVTINSMLYLTGFQLLDNDIIDQLVVVDAANTTVTNYGGELGDSLPENISGSTSLVAEVSGFSFFDALNIAWGFIKFMLNLIFAPIGLFVATGMPLVIQLLLGLPLGMAYIYGIIVLVRGGGG